MERDTRYRLDGLGIESQSGVRLSAYVQTNPGAHSAFYTLGTGSFLGLKQPGGGADHTPHPALRLKKDNRDICLLSLCVFMAGYRVNFTFTLFEIRHKLHNQRTATSTNFTVK